MLASGVKDNVMEWAKNMVLMVRYVMKASGKTAHHFSECLRDRAVEGHDNSTAEEKKVGTRFLMEDFARQP